MNVHVHTYFEHTDVLYSKRDHGLRDTIVFITQVSRLVGRHTGMFNYQVINGRGRDGGKDTRKSWFAMRQKALHCVALHVLNHFIPEIYKILACAAHCETITRINYTASYILKASSFKKRTTRSELFINIARVERDNRGVCMYNEPKNIFKMSKEVGMLLQKIANTSGVGKSNIMRKSIYLLTTTPTSHTYTF